MDGIRHPRLALGQRTESTRITRQLGLMSLCFRLATRRFRSHRQAWPWKEFQTFFGRTESSKLFAPIYSLSTPPFRIIPHTVRWRDRKHDRHVRLHLDGR